MNWIHACIFPHDWTIFSSAERLGVQILSFWRDLFQSCQKKDEQSKYYLEEERQMQIGKENAHEAQDLFAGVRFHKETYVSVEGLT